SAVEPLPLPHIAATPDHALLCAIQKPQGQSPQAIHGQGTSAQ
ncbi:MAG: hypothetical protein RL215_194, partial [Planctomycetota bacterium]